MRRLFKDALRSQVGIRMAGLFVLCTVVPLAGLAMLTVSRTSRQLEDQERQRMHRDARSVAQDALGRLDLLARNLEVIGAAFGEIAPTPTDVDHRSSGLPDALATDVLWKSGARPPAVLRGAIAMPVLSPSDEQQLADWGRLLLADPNERAKVHLVVRVPSQTSPADANYLVARVDIPSLFRLDDADALPPVTDVCVLAARDVIGCSSGVPAEALPTLKARGTDGDMTITTRADTYLARTWTITLRAGYSAEPWTVALMKPRGIVRGPISDFIRDFWIVAALSLLVVGWLVIGQIRRQMRPLESLVAATERLSRRDFSRRLELTSGDEFEVLGKSFNALSRDLQRQFAELEAFNIGSLSALARAVDAKSPWTAGHSERVTLVAVALGTEMRLPPEELDRLRRGGLVHDLGKLATPQEILDKAGPLTPAEREIIEQHPAQGVHILEAIPAFRPLLPIVGQHHERWDGTGYPKRLAGQQIDLAARVLAVADVCDALRSDRPYRRGMPPSRVVAIILEESGKAFDPAVVRAFAAVAANLDELVRRARMPWSSEATRDDQRGPRPVEAQAS